MVGLRIADGEILYDNDLDTIIKGIKRSGIISGVNALASVVPDMNINVQTGTCRSDNDTLITKGSITVLAITPNSSGNPRKDIVLMDNSGVITVLTGTPAPESGTPSPTPFPPDIPANSILLAEIYVANGATSITQSVIKDKRVMINSYLGTIESEISRLDADILSVETEMLRRPHAFLAQGW